MRFGKLSILGAFTAAALASSAAQAQVSDDLVKIGVLTDMNGPASTPGGRGSAMARIQRNLFLCSGDRGSGDAVLLPLTTMATSLSRDLPVSRLTSLVSLSLSYPERVVAAPHEQKRPAAIRHRHFHQFLAFFTRRTRAAPWLAPAGQRAPSPPPARPTRPSSAWDANAALGAADPSLA